MRIFYAPLLFCLIGCSTFVKPASPLICPSETESIRIAEFYSFSRDFGEDVWPAWNSASLAMLYIADQYEFLIGHANPPTDFSHSCDLKGVGKVWGRARQFDKGLLASFPVFDQVPLIVIGSSENTRKPSTDWLQIVVHEHFHQMQYSIPGYYPATLKLRPANSTDGSWMLNFDFPYSNPEVVSDFKTLGKLLLKATRTKDKKDILAYLKFKKTMRNRLGEENYKYFEFQAWQEGVARHAQIRALKVMVRNKFSQEFQALPDYEAPDNILSREESLISETLANLDLAEKKRAAFYAVGAAEAELLHFLNPSWQSRYFEHLLTLEPLFKIYL